MRLPINGQLATSGRGGGTLSSPCASCRPTRTTKLPIESKNRYVGTTITASATAPKTMAPSLGRLRETRPVSGYTAVAMMAPHNTGTKNGSTICRHQAIQPPIRTTRIVPAVTRLRKNSWLSLGSMRLISLPALASEAQPCSHSTDDAATASPARPAKGPAGIGGQNGLNSASFQREPEQNQRTCRDRISRLGVLGRIVPGLDIVRRSERRVDAAPPRAECALADGRQLEGQRLPKGVDHAV